MNGAMRGNSRQWQLAVVEKCDFVELRTQNSEQKNETLVKTHTTP